MTIFNQKFTRPEDAYHIGYLPQRNRKGLYYFESSCRSNLSAFKLSSENRRIINKTKLFYYTTIPLETFRYSSDIQKQIFKWTSNLNWNFPSSSIKTVFTNHIFNYLYQWYNENNEVVAYAVCYLSDKLSHIAYTFYNPQYDHKDLPVRIVLQFVIDSKNQGLDFSYLGRFSINNGYYKRNLPGFELFSNHSWGKLNK